jgi:hypothetical protein
MHRCRAKTRILPTRWIVPENRSPLRLGRSCYVRTHIAQEQRLLQLWIYSFPFADTRRLTTRRRSNQPQMKEFTIDQEQKSSPGYYADEKKTYLFLVLRCRVTHQILMVCLRNGRCDYNDGHSNLKLTQPMLSHHFTFIKALLIHASNNGSMAVTSIMNPHWVLLPPHII